MRVVILATIAATIVGLPRANGVRPGDPATVSTRWRLS